MPVTGTLRSPSYFRTPVWVITGLALVLRLFYLFDLRKTPFFNHPQMDALFHHDWATRLAGGDWLGSEVFFRAPGYPYFLGSLYALGFGFLGVRVVQLLIGSLTVFLVMRFMLPRYGSLAAYAAGALLALCGPLIYFEGELLLVVLEAPLFVLTLWTWVRAREKPDTVGRWITAGACLGLASWVRPIGLVVVPVLLIQETLAHRGVGFKRGLLYGVGLLLVLSPILVRNYRVGGDLVPVASQGGWNYYLGNHAGADGRAALAPGVRPDWQGGLEDMQLKAERALGHRLKPSEVSRYWYGQAWDWARSDPTRFLRHQIRKLGYFWDGFEIPNNQDYTFFSKLTRLFQAPVITFGLIGPLALVGLVLGLRNKQLSFPVAALPFLLMAVIVSFFVCGRFRASLIPLFSVLAGVGVGAYRQLVRSRAWYSMAVIAGLFALGFWFANGDVHGFQTRHSAAESYYRLGVFYGTQGEDKKAREFYGLALNENSAFVEVWNNLGILEAESGHLSLARRDFERAFDLNPSYVATLSNLAALELQEGHRAEAMEYARAVEEQVIFDGPALYNAAVVLGNLGEIEAARKLFQRILDHHPGHGAARVGLARAQLALGDPDSARVVLEGVPPEDRSEDMKHLLQELNGSK